MQRSFAKNFYTYNFPSGATAIYSMRLTNDAYAGNCIKIRRASDNTTLNVGFVNGVVDWFSAATFGAGTVMFVDTWYDQSGNSNDASNSSTINQPQFVMLGGTPWVSFGVVSNVGQQLNTANPITLTGDQTLGLVAMLGSDLTQLPLQCYDGSKGWMLLFNGLGTNGAVGDSPTNFGYWSDTGAESDDTTNLFTGSKCVHRVAITRTSGALQFYIDGTATSSVTGKGNAAPSTGMGIGGLGSIGYCFEGIMSEVFVYPSALSGTSLTGIFNNQNVVFPDLGFYSFYNGTAAVQFGDGQQIICGDVLAFEKTNTWTVFIAMQSYNTSSSGASLLYTNVPYGNPAFPGHEFWIDGQGLGVGQLRVRIMHDIGNSNYIDVRGSTQVVDGRPHMLSYSYDGSGTAAGVKIYVDGVLETMVTISDTLSGSIIGVGQSLYIGNQQGYADFNMRGTISHFQIDNVVRSNTYIRAFSTPTSLPPVDGNTAICLPLTEGSGTTANDTSGNGLNGAMSAPSMWVT